MRFPDAVRTFDQDEPEVRDAVTNEVLQSARTVTKQAQYVLIIELTLNQATYFVRTDDVEQYMQALRAAPEGENQGAPAGTWCIKYMDGSPKYGLLASEDPAGTHGAALFQKGLDRIKALSTRILRDKTSGAILDGATLARIS